MKAELVLTMFLLTTQQCWVVAEKYTWCLPVGGIFYSNLTFSEGWKETVHNCRAGGAVTEIVSKTLSLIEKTFYMETNSTTRKKQNKVKYPRMVRVQILESGAWILSLLFTNCELLKFSVLIYLFENEDDDGNTGHLTKL